MGNGLNTFFWSDIWFNDTPLKTQFPNMYSMSRFPNTKVADNWVEDEWQVEFKRSLTPTKYDDLLTLLSLLQSCHLTPLDDAIDWALEKNKSYSIKSLYSCLTDRGVRIRSSDSVWNVKVPLKIKVFLWQIDNNRLPTALSLRQRGWKGSSLCCLCGNSEDSNHIYFGCSLACFLWCGIRDALGWSDFPFSWEDWRG